MSQEPLYLAILREPYRTFAARRLAAEVVRNRCPQGKGGCDYELATADVKVEIGTKAVPLYVRTAEVVAHVAFSCPRCHKSFAEDIPIGNEIAKEILSSQRRDVPQIDIDELIELHNQLFRQDWTFAELSKATS